MEYTLAFDQLVTLVLLGSALGVAAAFLLLADRARGADRCSLCLRDSFACRTCEHNPRPAPRPALTWDPVAHEVHEARRERED